ncbi:bifunctional diaminohydroxyphosphoribosylaminopyrimidine deaminase/5-amino-6-(5-phosphoribosylamino)uracil reductase RibD [Paracidovorax cattleyae]|uniref:Riboflavin biosynthesis protein RibD n=1 Tax=Paracidovorax cattleyae TaxID=80868 RepID=A0A1H0LIE8_9BURK|nr:bifunctional diaminohydroxyphosphoribosylaminopyrimidine deaminase/5-amino-6-(5-phosphoribosylamino)uracil reductase RibD [Paracidovorax cattleyae]AVS75236.1 bifunctional diaminohydroxyphosphoribosylaminopyrimidine deaminase/5-amino-6-(5-phosphoribosylamino)uracil reductase RibD [Paracidovorax cattleyae]SDO67720.1 diaminohydroxyphosphoribosylaminopyrimidine deaminase / 5-amino-6-(5-phosphoribosylamino)uracil reductase [Paracidovorax cattleyae]
MSVPYASAFPIDFMQRALQLAEDGLYRTSPNPRVGCVLVNADQQVIGQGSTQRAGGPHAEIMALRDARARGHATRGATAYVTLEPCSHHGRTGPCCDALVEAGIARVVASVGDPNPRVAGQGFARLRAAGVEVEVGPGAEASRELNIGFLSRMVRRLPWVRLKSAASLDGITALPDGQSQWITSAAARADAHAWRARACVVLTGVGTVLADDPRLDVREVPTERQPWVAVLDSRLRTPPDAALLRARERSVVIYCAIRDESKESALRASGATVVHLPGPDGRVALHDVMADLAAREANEVHVEAGAIASGALCAAGLVDEVLLYLAPKLLGQGRGIAPFGPLPDLGQALGLTIRSVAQVGPDLRVCARVASRESMA